MANQHSALHGHARKGKESPEYKSWMSMKHRCNSKSGNNYKSYASRGITVCEKWMKFEGFLEDMGRRPIGMTLDRIDVNGNYCKENCRWATVEQQMSNQRNSQFFECFGKTQTIPQWAREFRIDKETLRRRIVAGVPPEIALSAKPRPGYRREKLKTHKIESAMLDSEAMGADA